CALAAGLGDQFCDQTALADAGFAHDRDELTLARERGLQGIPELRQLDLAAHERRLDGERTGIEHTFRATARRSDAGGARRSDRPLRRSPLQYLLVERPRLLIGLRVQFALERSHAELVLTESGPATSKLRVQSHECAVYWFQERVQGDQPERDWHGLVKRTCVLVLGEKPRERRQGQFAEPQALGDEPFLERWLLQCEPFEEITLVDGSRLVERFPCAAGHTLLEDLHIHGHQGGVERDCFPYQPERFRNT